MQWRLSVPLFLTNFQSIDRGKVEIGFKNRVLGGGLRVQKKGRL